MTMPATTTSADQAAFIAKIVSEPDCDTSRLVYADWLTENDRADEGELVRLQCELASPNRPPFCAYACNSRIDYRCKWCELGDREVELLAALPPLTAACPRCRGEKRLPPFGAEGVRSDCPSCSGSGTLPVERRRGFAWGVKVERVMDVLIGNPRWAEGEWEDPPAYEPTSWAVQLFSLHPTLSRIVPGDREPFLTAAGFYRWWREDPQNPSSSLPGIVYDRMRKNIAPLAEWPRTRELAMEVCSTAIADVCRPEVDAPAR